MAGQDESTADMSATFDTSSDDIDFSTPAIVAWDSGATLTDLTLDVRRVASNNTAFFKLRAALVLKGLPLAPIAFFLFVHPERIRSLELDASEPQADTAALELARNKFGLGVTCLRFTLDRPADLVGPKDTALTPKNRIYGQVLDSMRALSRQNSFAIYFPQKVAPKARLISLCNATRAGALRSIARHADIASLYRGKGGQVIVDSSVAADAITASISPPSYDEIEPGPPSAPLATPDGRDMMLDLRSWPTLT